MSFSGSSGQAVKPRVAWKTDEEFMKGASQQEWDYHNFHHWIIEDPKRRALTNQYNETVKKYPDQSVRTGYHDWVKRWYKRYEAWAPPEMTVEQFFNLNCGTDFAHPKSRAQWHTMMETSKMPFIRLGVSDFGGFKTCYGLLPGPFYLHANRDDPADINDASIVHSCILGINLDVNVINYGPSVPTSSLGRSQRHQPPLPITRESQVRPSQLRDLHHGHGFVFAQLGALYVFDGERSWEETRQMGEKAIADGPWKPTNFGVVVEINMDRGARAGAVHVIYNFHTQAYDSHGDISGHEHIRTHDKKNKLLEDIGRLHPRVGRVFSVAKIADNLKHLGDGKMFYFKPESQLPGGDSFECQIVRAKSVPMGNVNVLLRQFIWSGP